MEMVELSVRAREVHDGHLTIARGRDHRRQSCNEE